MKENIKSQDLEEIMGNQKKCGNDAPVTTIATFKLSELKALIEEIETHKLYKRTDNEDFSHSVCITFVRQKMVAEDSHPLYKKMEHFKQLKKYETKKSGKQYSQLIPVIMGCMCKLDKHDLKTLSFEFLSHKDGAIPFVRPGGEGTGLIPPPPKGGQ